MLHTSKKHVCCTENAFDETTLHIFSAQRNVEIYSLNLKKMQQCGLDLWRGLLNTKIKFGTPYEAWRDLIS